jgi:hypothetical protein
VSAEQLNILKKLAGKFQKDVGLVVWGVDETGKAVKVLVKSDGTVIVEGVVTVSGSVDVSDRWSRQLGQVDIARYLGSAIGLANPLHSQIVYGGAVIDPRQIRALTASDIVTVNNLLNPHPITATDLDIRNLSKLSDEVYAVLRTDAGVAYDARDRNWTITETLNVGNPPNLDVSLSTRASETKLESVRALLDSLENALASVGTDKFRTSIVEALPTGTNSIGSVTQASRTNLKVQIEREDIITKSWDLTVGTTSLLSAVAGQKHKIYGWDYEADTDGANEFSATINGATAKFARRVTKGVHAMTLVHPIVCDANTALSFVSAGNTKLSLRYVTEA